jgi:ABC-type Co2+ transport system permease subunit
LLLAWGLVFLGWIATGFQPNLFDHPGAFSLTQEAFNMATKDGLAAIYVFGAVAPFHFPSRASAVKPPSPVVVPAARGHGDSVHS